MLDAEEDFRALLWNIRAVAHSDNSPKIFSAILSSYLGKPGAQRDVKQAEVSVPVLQDCQ